MFLLYYTGRKDKSAAFDLSHKLIGQSFYKTMLIKITSVGLGNKASTNKGYYVFRFQQSCNNYHQQTIYNSPAGIYQFLASIGSRSPARQITPPLPTCIARSPSVTGCRISNFLTSFAGHELLRIASGCTQPSTLISSSTSRLLKSR